MLRCYQVMSRMSWGSSSPSAGRLIGCGPLVRPEHIAHAMDGLPPRVLVRVYERMPQDRFDTTLPAFAPETVALLWRGQRCGLGLQRFQLRFEAGLVRGQRLLEDLSLLGVHALGLRAEADAKAGRISYNSPLGRALIGRVVEDEVELTVPSGDKYYLVSKIEFI